MTDEQAILRCQDGEREAFCHVVDEYKDVLYGTALDDQESGAGRGAGPGGLPGGMARNSGL